MDTKKRDREKGFTLIEIVVILGVIAILVAILTPAVLKYLDDARNRRAEADVKQIAGALLALIKDTGQYPGDIKIVGCLVSDGDVLGAGGLITDCSATNENLSKHLITNTSATPYSSTGRFKWSGPYINELKPDPWGNAYVVADNSNLVGNNTTAVWVMSAGPNGVFNTSAIATALSGDDIGVRLK